MGIYKIPLEFKAGEFKFGELPDYKNGECLELDYDNEYQIMTYEVPLYENEARIYTVPRELIPSGLTAAYDDDGVLDKVELSENGKTRLIYIRFKNIKASERAILKFVKEQANNISDVIIKRKQTLARLFVEKFYDGEAVDIAAKTATAEEMQAVIDEYDGDAETADNSGNYPVENRVELDRETLGVMMMCTNSYFTNILYNKASETFAERLESRVLKKTKTTEDFRFICEEYD